jgi:hypothetical protein
MPCFPVFKKKWRLNLWRGNGLIILAAPLIDRKSLFNESLEKIYGDKRKIVFSQFVDENQWKIGNRSEFVNKMATRHLVDLAVTANYSEESVPKIEDHTYIFHGVASPKLEFLNDLFRYGMTNLPNIIYEYRENTTDWLSQLVNWNKQFLSWYQFKTSDKPILDLMNQIGLISWTSDYYLSVGIINVDQLIKVLDGLEKVADDRSLSLVLSTKRLSHPLEH